MSGDKKIPKVKRFCHFCGKETMQEFKVIYTGRWICTECKNIAFEPWRIRDGEERDYRDEYLCSTPDGEHVYQRVGPDGSVKYCYKIDSLGRIHIVDPRDMEEWSF